MIDDSHIIYPGHTEHYDFGEWQQETGFIVVDHEDKPEINYIKVESQPMMQLKLHTSHMKQDKITEFIKEQVVKASNLDGLLQLVLEGDLPFKKYTEIDFTELSRLGSSQNFYFEFVDRIKPTGEGLDFSKGEGLNPRKRLEEIGREAIDTSLGDDQKIWQQALEYAVEYYLQEKDQ
jgi:DNA repair exonuclease SbcCD nuclease subunit